jgi:hypothetical protein
MVSIFLVFLSSFCISSWCPLMFWSIMLVLILPVFQFLAFYFLHLALCSKSVLIILHSPSSPYLSHFCVKWWLCSAPKDMLSLTNILISFSIVFTVCLFLMNLATF